jgi:hypothetical protein
VVIIILETNQSLNVHAFSCREEERKREREREREREEGGGVRVSECIVHFSLLSPE